MRLFSSRDQFKSATVVRVSRSWMVFLSRKKNAMEQQNLTSIAETHTLPLAEDRNDPCPQMWLQRARLASKPASLSSRPEKKAQKLR